MGCGQVAILDNQTWPMHHLLAGWRQCKLSAGPTSADHLILLELTEGVKASDRDLTPPMICWMPMAPPWDLTLPALYRFTTFKILQILGNLFVCLSFFLLFRELAFKRKDYYVRLDYTWTPSARRWVLIIKLSSCSMQNEFTTAPACDWRCSYSIRRPSSRCLRRLQVGKQCCTQF